VVDHPRTKVEDDVGSRAPTVIVVDNQTDQGERPREVTPPTLNGVAVRLRPIDPSDLEFLYLISMASENGFRWRYRGSVPDRNEFVKGISTGVLVQFIVERMATLERVGLVSAYGANFRDGWVYIAALSSPDHAHSGAAVDGLIVLVNYVFQNWPMRKIYLEAMEYNYLQFERYAPSLATEEGRLRDHVFYDGRYWDAVTSAIYRKEWSENRPLNYLDGTQAASNVNAKLGFSEFCEEIRASLDLGSVNLEEKSRLIEDLDFDSLRMVELAALIEDFAGRTGFEMMGEIETLRDAYMWYCTAASMPVV
jgi:RimJ/RimL family protein N-acetyltransferase